MLFQITALFSVVTLWISAPLPSEGLGVVSGGSLPSPRNALATFYDGEDSVYIFGGGVEADRVELTDVLVYNITSEQVQKVGDFPQGIKGGAVGTDGAGGIYYTCGFGWGLEVDSVWKSTQANPTPLPVFNFERFDTRSSHSVFSDGVGGIYMVGGAGTFIWRNDITKYDTNSNTVQEVGKFPHGLYGASTAYVGGSAYIFGGSAGGGEVQNDIYKFTPATGSVARLDTPLPENIMFTSAVAVGEDSIYIVGGNVPDGSAHLNQLMRFDIPTESIETFSVENMRLRLDTSAVYVEKLHRIYTFGGTEDYDTYLDEINYIQL